MSSTIPTKITFYDIDSERLDSQPFSPFCARVRYVLNYKQLTYTTILVSLGDIQATCEKHGFKPTGIRADGSLRYTLPAIIDETETSHRIAMSDSYPIIKYLDRTYPDPSRALFPSLFGSPSPSNTTVEHLPAIHMLVDAYFKQLFFSKAYPLVLGGIHDGIRPDGRRLWKQKTFGDPDINIEDVVMKKGSKEWEDALEELKNALGVVAGFMELNGGAKWLLGDKPKFVDFAILSFWRIPKMADREVWEAIKGVGGGIFGMYVEAGDVYMKWK